MDQGVNESLWGPTSLVTVRQHHSGDWLIWYATSTVNTDIYTSFVNPVGRKVSNIFQLHTCYVLLSAMFEKWVGVSIIIVTLRWVDLMTVLNTEENILDRTLLQSLTTTWNFTYMCMYIKGKFSLSIITQSLRNK